MSLRRVAASLAVAVLLAGASRQQQPVVQWIRTNAIRLTTPEARHGFADMEPLRKVVGDARIVSLGEATHGTREFFQLKHRMLEFLATEMGFTIFSIEASMPEAYRLNDYVLTGQGDPQALLRGMYFWTWDTEEVLDMIHWMREFNASGKGPVQFTGFDMQTPTVAAEIARNYVLTHENDYEPTVSAAADVAERIYRGNVQAVGAFGVATGTFPVGLVAGKTVTYSGYIKTASITTGYAGLWWRVDGDSQTLALKNMQDQNIQGTRDWQRYEVTIPVARNARGIAFGVLHPGDGTAWFDSLTVTIDGQAYQGAALREDDEWSPFSVKGGVGYQVALDSAVVRDGRTSLRIRYLGPSMNGIAPPDIRAAVTQWNGITAHLDSTNRVTPSAEGAWAAQNARVVLQGLQMRAGQVIRDQSMANNVKWILDQNPRAKIVLWAHNGHVAAESPIRPSEVWLMGRYLRAMYGKQMVVFGFAFNQGSFQSIGADGGGLRGFTVPPLDASSFDATLASAGIPLFALDLRAKPASGPVAEWLAAPHQTRWIGSTFSEQAPQNYLNDLTAPNSFDVVLFVDKTTAARATPK